MTPFVQFVIDSLLSQHEQAGDAARQQLREHEASLETTVRVIDEKWGLVEKKHERSLRESTSAAWTNSLQSLHAERKRKNDETKAQFVAALDRARSARSTTPLDTGTVGAALRAIEEEVLKYEETLSIKRRQTESTGDYGEIDNEKWIKEIVRFIDRNPTVAQALGQLHRVSAESGLEVNWGAIVAKLVDQTIDPATTLPDILPSDGAAFEHACLLILHNSGWTATLTPPSGDQGVDILAKKDDITVAIQCKNYRAPFGNSAVQEVHAGRSFYEADVAVVVSLSGFTPSASQLAKKLRVLLIDQVSLENLEGLL